MQSCEKEIKSRLCFLVLRITRPVLLEMQSFKLVMYGTLYSPYDNEQKSFILEMFGHHLAA